MYFDPEDPAALAGCLRELAGSAERRAELAQRAFESASRFRWDRCAEETFAFLAEVAGGPAARRSE